MFANSKFVSDQPSTSAEWIGLVVGAGIALAGITTAFVMYLQRPGVTIALRDRFPRLAHMKTGLRPGRRALLRKRTGVARRLCSSGECRGIIGAPSTQKVDPWPSGFVTQVRWLHEST